MSSLKIVKDLIFNLNGENITYCHFKSNEHLEAALNGNTDLDILFEIQQKDRCEEILLKNGFIRMAGVKARKYPGIEDYIGIDPESGRIVHVHGHFKLMGGESGVKPYHIRLERWLLYNREKSTENIYVASPSTELILLLLRACLKQTWWSRALSLVGLSSLSEDDIREIGWLVGQTSLYDVKNSVPDVLENNIKSFPKLFDGTFSSYDLWGLYKVWRSTLSVWRVKNNFQILKTRLNYFFVRVNSKFSLVKRPVRRVFESSPGLIVAILGCDGSGKSTQVKLVTKELRRKIDTKPYYMGSGDGKAKWYRLPLKFLIKVRAIYIKKHSVNKSSHKNIMRGKNKKTHDKWSFHLVWKFLWAIILASERKDKLREISNLRKDGAIIVCDRYPQVHVHNMNDGPLLFSYINSKNSLLRYISNWEYKIYQLSESISPDVVIKLWAPIDILKNRRKEMGYEKLDDKQNALLDITFSKDVRVVKIKSVDGERYVFCTIMNEIARNMLKKSPVTS